MSGKSRASGGASGGARLGAGRPRRVAKLSDEQLRIRTRYRDLSETLYRTQQLVKIAQHSIDELQASCPHTICFYTCHESTPQEILMAHADCADCGKCDIRD
jgi:hypothetical protein